MESEIRKRIREFREADPEMTGTEIATTLGVSRARIGQLLKGMGLPTRTAKTYETRSYHRPTYNGPPRTPEPATLPFADGCSTVMRGAWAELLVAADLMRRGYEVFTHIYGSSSCDLIAVREGKCARVEVKKGQWQYTRYVGIVAPGRRKQFDVLAVVSGEGQVEYQPPLPLEKGECEEPRRGH